MKPIFNSSLSSCCVNYWFLLTLTMSLAKCKFRLNVKKEHHRLDILLLFLFLMSVILNDEVSTPEACTMYTIYEPEWIRLNLVHQNINIFLCFEIRWDISFYPLSFCWILNDFVFNRKIRLNKYFILIQIRKMKAFYWQSRLGSLRDWYLWRNWMKNNNVWLLRVEINHELKIHIISLNFAPIQIQRSKFFRKKFMSKKIFSPVDKIKVRTIY